MAEQELSVKERILAGLNDQQKEAVINYEGACILNAGPGAGKTKTLISRTAFMIENGVNPNNILLFTFTRKAAKEIKDRVQAQIGEKADGVTVGTYHSFCMRLLRKYAQYLGWTKSFSIYDDEDKKGLLKALCATTGEDVRTVGGTISRFKQHLLSPIQAAQIAENDYERTAAEIYKLYMQKMKEANAFDFDDLIYYAIRLMEEFPIVKHEINKKYTYITCDEAHDSSPEDLRLIELLGGDLFNVCMILDCDQSIYSFRGADMGAVYEFMEDHGFRQFMLERNYRSTQIIVDAAKSVVMNNNEPIQKNIYSENEVGTKIVYAALGDVNQESNYVVRILKAMSSQGYDYKDMAVLYRMQYQSRSVEEALLKNSVPYKIVGGTPFYGRKEIKDIVSYLRFILNPFDGEAFKRIINTPKRGIGDKTVERIFSCYESLVCDTIPTDGLLAACRTVKLTGKAKASMEHFLAIIDQLAEYIEVHKPSEVVDETVKLTGYIGWLNETEKDSDAENRISNLLELQEIATAYTDVQDFLNNMVLNTQKADEDESYDGVNLMTMHASKGLEFPVVVIVGANDGTVPHFKAVYDGDVSEERRLFYVAMTRAEKFLFITRSKVIMRQGMPQPCKQSRFIAEVDSKYLKKV